MSEEVLLEKIENLSRNVDEGFKGVHLRQDTTNGRITKGEDRIRVLEKWMYVLIGAGSILGLFPTLQEIIKNLAR